MSVSNWSANTYTFRAVVCVDICCLSPQWNVYVSSLTKDHEHLYDQYGTFPESVQCSDRNKVLQYHVQSKHCGCGLCIASHFFAKFSSFSTHYLPI